MFLTIRNNTSKLTTRTSRREWQAFGQCDRIGNSNVEWSWPLLRRREIAGECKESQDNTIGWNEDAPRARHSIRPGFRLHLWHLCREWARVIGRVQNPSRRLRWRRLTCGANGYITWEVRGSASWTNRMIESWRQGRGVDFAGCERSRRGVSSSIRPDMVVLEFENSTALLPTSCQSIISIGLYKELLMIQTWWLIKIPCKIPDDEWHPGLVAASFPCPLPWLRGIRHTVLHLISRSHLLVFSCLPWRYSMMILWTHA